MQMVYIALIGLLGGTLSGLFGIGGGVVMVPLMLLLGFTPQKAAGTSLAALVPPVGLLAAMTYYKHGDLDLRDAGLLAVGLLLGSWASSQFAVSLPAALAKQIFGGFLVVIGLRFLLVK